MQPTDRPMSRGISLYPDEYGSECLRMIEASPEESTSLRKTRNVKFENPPDKRSTAEAAYIVNSKYFCIPSAVVRSSETSVLGRDAIFF